MSSHENSVSQDNNLPSSKRELHRFSPGCTGISLSLVTDAGLQGSCLHRTGSYSSETCLKIIICKFALNVMNKAILFFSFKIWL